jgi:hypothetical protein
MNALMNEQKLKMKRSHLDRIAPHIRNKGSKAIRVEPSKLECSYWYSSIMNWPQARICLRNQPRVVIDACVLTITLQP